MLSHIKEGYVVKFANGTIGTIHYTHSGYAFIVYKDKDDNTKTIPITNYSCDGTLNFKYSDHGFDVVELKGYPEFARYLGTESLNFRKLIWCKNIDVIKQVPEYILTNELERRKKERVINI